MDRSIRAAILLIAPIALAALSGCPLEDVEKDLPLSITGTVTYHGGPVKKGAIHFLPVAPGDSPASGAIVDGEIKDVFTRTPGDGIKPGKYRIAITAFDEAFLESVAKRDANGPDPVEVGRAADNIRKLIPPRYSNPRDSGLTAEFSPSHRTLDLKLVD
jgi:hypothetical protein